MQAILTKRLPATNTRPFRIKATCARGSITVCEDSSSGDAHAWAANALLAARRRAIKAEFAFLNPKPVKHRMILVEGIVGVTTKVVYSYRGHTITRTYRTYDSGNQTHNGYWWSVAFVEGGGVPNRPTRKEAKAAVDRYMDAAKAAEIRADHARIPGDFDMAGPEGEK
jgi:hypothetical protein